MIFFYLELGCLNSSTLISFQRKKQIGKTNELKNDVPSRTPNITNITAKRDIKDFNENRRENGTFLLKIKFKFSRKNQHKKKSVKILETDRRPKKNYNFENSQKNQLIFLCIGSLFRSL